MIQCNSCNSPGLANFISGKALLGAYLGAGIYLRQGILARILTGKADQGNDGRAIQLWRRVTWDEEVHSFGLQRSHTGLERKEVAIVVGGSRCLEKDDVHLLIDWTIFAWR